MFRPPDRLDAERVSDRLAIDDLWAAYADAVSKLDAEATRQLFSPDGVVTLTSIGTYTGVDAIVEMLSEVLPPWDTLIHALHSRRAWFDRDDPTLATGQVYFSEFGMRAGVDTMLAGVYHDRFHRGDEGIWRFSARRYDRLFHRIGGVATAFTYPADLR